MHVPFRSKRFEVTARIGAGGMGVVYEANDLERNVKVALKTIRDPAAGSLLRFKNEFRALHDLKHPNLVSLGELHEEQGVWFFTMELVAGVDFLSWVRGGDATEHRSSDASRGVETSVSRPLTPEEQSAGTLAIALTTTAPREALLGPAVVVRVSHPNDAERLDAPAAFPPAPPAPAPSTVRFDEARLRSGLRQLAEGLCALHAARCVHRDIKPSNVLVTREGRAVLLDFGLVSDSAGSGSTNVEVVGTAEYMAPEQASAQHVGPEADWYAVGVLLFEVLVGRFPFEGATLHVLIEKQRRVAPVPSDLVEGIPADLDRLCVDLLQRDAHARPSGEEVLRRLAEHGDMISEPRIAPPSAPESDGFIGRVREREALHDAATGALDPELARAVSIVIEGESGVGKSALMSCFLSSLSAQSADVLVLRGRCYERETVTFKAFDGVVDALANYLRGLEPIAAAGLVPRYASILLDVFPVLGVVPALAKAPAPRNAASTPAERRNRLFDAMRELFQRLRLRAPVVLAIDDVQWADADSVALLQEIVRPPDGPALLIVGTSRPLSALAPGAAAGPNEPLATAGGPFAGLTPHAHTVRLGRLPVDEARALAAQLLSSRSSSRPPAKPHDAREVDLEAIVRESAGHPLFIDALVRHAQSETTSTSSVLRLDDALWSRVISLDAVEPAVRRLVEVVGLTGSPVSIELAREAAGISREAIGEVVRQAQQLNLVKTTGPRLTDRIESYHDRVRESVTSHLTPTARSALHRTIADAIAARSPDESELLAIHLLGAGARAGAVEQFLAAARSAFRALAIDHAAALYRRALELGVDDPATLREATIALGDVLATAGRGAEAAATYDKARTLGVDEHTEFELSRRIAEQLLQSGHLREGRAALARVLGRLGIPYARSPWIALAKALVRKLFIRLRGYGFVVRERDAVSARDVLRLEVLWTAVRGLMFIDFLRGFDFQSRFVLLAMEVGDRRHLANGLAAEASSGAASGAAGLARAGMLFAKLDQVSEPIDDPAVLAHNHSHRSFMHFFAGEFTAARREGELGMSMYAELCLGVNWYLVAMRRYLVFSYYYLGDFSELQRRLKPWRSDAHRRGDLFAMANYSLGVANVSYLIDDDLEGANDDIERALHRWTIDGMTSQQLQGAIARTQLDLYAGRVDVGRKRLEALWPALERSLLLKARNLNVECRHLRARAAVALAVTQRGTAQRAMLGLAEREVKTLRRDGLDWSRAFAELVASAVSFQRGDLGQSETQLRAAIEAFSRAEMHLYAAAARARLGALVGGDHGARSVDDAHRAFRVHGVARPERMVAMMAPGFSAQE